MADKELLEPSVATPQGEDWADIEWNDAIVMLKTFGNWMLCTFVPMPPMRCKESKVRSPVAVRDSSLDFGA